MDIAVAECQTPSVTVECVSHVTPYHSDHMIKYFENIPGTHMSRHRYVTDRSGISLTDFVINSEVGDILSP